MSYMYYRAGLGAIVLLGFLGYRVIQRDSRSDELLSDAHELVSHCSLYAQHREYIDNLCESAHGEAFRHAYTVGGRRTSSWLNASLYTEDLFHEMIRHASSDGSTHIAEDLGKLQRKIAEGKVHLIARPWER